MTGSPLLLGVVSFNKGSLAAGHRSVMGIPMMVGANFHDVKRAQKRDPAGVLQYTVLEPVPFRLALAQSVLAAAQNRHAGLLWFDWLATAEEQKIADEHEPMASVAYVRGSA